MEHIYISRNEMEMIDAKEVFLLIVVALSHAWLGLMEMGEERRNYY